MSVATNKSSPESNLRCLKFLKLLGSSRKCCRRKSRKEQSWWMLGCEKSAKKFLSVFGPSEFQANKALSQIIWPAEKSKQCFSLFPVVRSFSVYGMKDSATCNQMKMVKSKTHWKENLIDFVSDCCVSEG